MPEWIDPNAISKGLIMIPPVLLMIYLGIYQAVKYPHGLSTLAIWGLTSTLILDWLRRSVYWIALGFGADISQVTHSSQLIFSVNVSLFLLLGAIYNERFRREQRLERSGVPD